MIAKEMEEGAWEQNLSSNVEPGAPRFPVEARHMYRYEEVTVRGLRCLAKRSCKGCHGTGKVGRVMDPRTKTWHNQYCTCLIQEEEEDATQEEG